MTRARLRTSRTDQNFQDGPHSVTGNLSRKRAKLKFSSEGLYYRKETVTFWITLRRADQKTGGALLEFSALRFVCNKIRLF